MNVPLKPQISADDLPQISGAAALLNGHYAPPPTNEDGKTWVRTSTVIQGTPMMLYEFWRDIEASPAWHERIVDVRRIGTDRWHWVMRHEPGDEVLEWDFEIMADEPGTRIAWRSLSGEPENAGEVLFEPAPGGRGTMVTVLEQFRLGRLARTWETITGRDPVQSTIENLRHFKALVETGEVPRVEPQPHGDRGTGAGVNQWMYGEVVATPPGSAAI